MTFPESIRTCMLTKVFTLSGRASRSEFWWFILAGLLFNLFGGLILLIPLLGAIAYFGLSLWFFCANLTVTVRRLHDTDHRGWWLLLPLLSSIVLCGAAMLMIGPYYANISYYDADNIIIGIVAVSTLIVLGSYLILLIFCVKKGTTGPNRFGPDPLQAYQQGPEWGTGYGPNFDPGAAQGYNPNFGPQGPQGPNGPYQGPQGPYQGYGPNYDPNYGPQGPYPGYGPSYGPQGPQDPYQGPAPNYNPNVDPSGPYQGPQGAPGPQGPYQGPWQQPAGPHDWPYQQPQPFDQGVASGPWTQAAPQNAPQDWPYQQPQQFQQGQMPDQIPEATFNGEPGATAQSQDQPQAQMHQYYPEAEQGMYAPPEPPTKARNLWDQDPPHKP